MAPRTVRNMHAAGFQPFAAPSIPPDLNTAMRRSVANLGNIAPLVDFSNNRIGKGLTVATFIATIGPNGDEPTLLLPSNQRRVWFLLVPKLDNDFDFDHDDVNWFSYGFPTAIPNFSGLFNQQINTWGLPLSSPAFFFQPSSGPVSVDDIWVTTSAFPAVDQSGTFIGFEGSFAINQENMQ